jgi:AcrR family transcriptional regulator
MAQPSPRWHRKPDERPQEILRAALDVFSDKGYRVATMQEVAEAAGITKGTIYLYFGSKKDLFIAVVRWQLERMFATLPEVTMDLGANLEEMARSAGGAVLDTLLAPDVAKFTPLVLAELNHLPDIRALYQEEVLPRADATLAVMLEHGMDTGALRKADPVIAARCLLGMFFAFVFTQEVFGAKAQTPMKKEDILETITTIFFRGLLEEGGRR